MAGLHGKNAQLLIGNSLTIVSSGSLNRISGTDIYQIDSSNRDWMFQPDNSAFKVEYQVGASWYSLDLNSAQIHYAGGAVQIIGVTDATYAVVKNVARSTLVDVTHKINQNRSWEVRFETNLIDATVMGEFWGTSLPGIPKFTGTIEGLYLDSSKYEKAVVNASGVTIRRILRLRPTTAASTYYQGAANFSNWRLSASFDAPIQETLEFGGEGPLDLIKAGSPFFGPLF